METYSSEPIGKVGLYKYAQAEDFEILLLSYVLDDSPVTVIDLAQGEELPKEIRVLLTDQRTIKHAFNAAFEWYCLSRYLAVPESDWVGQWRDTQLQAMYCGYPMSLDAVGKAIGLPEDKQKKNSGKALIKTFCVPRKPTTRDPRTRIQPHEEPEKWRLFKEYNQQDVLTEIEIEKRLEPYPVPDTVQRQWETDLCINARGVALDEALINGALACSNLVIDPLQEEAKKLTGLDNPNSPKQLKEWMGTKGYETKTLKKEDVESFLAENDLDPNVRRALEIRQELSKTSNKKYDAMQLAAGSDNRIRGTLQFYGANRTGRWAGRIIQPQNLPRTNLHGEMLDVARDLVKRRDVNAIQIIYGSVQDTLSQLIRTALVPSPGHVFLDADFSAIEARVIAWLAGEEKVLEVFRGDGKIYEATASQMFGVPMDKIVKGSPEYALRQKGKVATLACGYGGAAGALINMGALKMGLAEEDLPDIVQRWRASHKKIVQFWYQAERAAVKAIQTGKPQIVRYVVFRLEADPDMDQTFLTIQLPAGRKLYYAQPEIQEGKWGGPAITYMDLNQTSRKWQRSETYGGKLVENITQAVARDCLAEKIEELEDRGYKVVFHVHDEVVIDVPRGQADLDKVIKVMSAPIEWCKTLPLNADGWIGDYYTKD